MRTITALAALAALTAAAPAHAECDAKQLTKDLAEASPVSMPKVFVKLADCDAGAAKAAAPAAMKRALPGDEGATMAVAALRVGAPEAVASWISAMQVDQRSDVLDGLASQCAAEQPVADFFADAKSREGDQFWKDRWYRGLASCRSPRIQAILEEAISTNGNNSALASDRALYFAVLEVYARNLGAKAVPRLEALVTETADEKEKRIVVSAFADAANVGDAAGMNGEAAMAAVEALKRLGPTLGGSVVEQARDTLLALGADELARQFAQHRWPERRSDGKYTYLAVAHELVTCKNGKKQGYLHYGDVVEPGAVWPADLQSKLVETLRAKWRLDAADKCKGTAEMAYEITSEPVAGEAEASEWLEGQRKVFTSKVAGFDKTDEVEEPAINL